MVMSKENYEDLRNKRLEENKRRIEELNLPQLTQALKTAHSPKPSPMKRAKPRVIGTEMVEVRRSSRVQSLPAPVYKEIVVYERVTLPKSGRKYSYSRKDLGNRVYASDEARPMLQYIGLPSHFCRKNLPRNDATVTLIDEDGDEIPDVYCDNNTQGLVVDGGVSPSVMNWWMAMHSVAKDLWEKVQLLMQGTSLTKQERECKLYDAFDKFAHIKGESLHQYYLRFTQQINDMNIYNMKLEQFQVNTKFLNSLPPEWTITYPSAPYPHAYSSRGLFTPQSVPQIEYTVSTVNQLTHLAEFSQIDSGLAVLVFKQGDDPIDAINKMMSFLSTCWELNLVHLVLLSQKLVLLTRLKTAGYRVTTTGSRLLLLLILNDMENQAVHAMQDFEQTPVVDFTDNEIHRNMILEEESRSKLSEKEKDPEAIKQNISHKPIDYEKLNRLSDDFGKCFTLQQELSAEQAFWLRMSNRTSKPFDASTVKIEAPKELPKKDLLEMKQVDQYAKALSSISTIMNCYIDNKLGDAINKAIQAHNFNCREEAQAEKMEYIELVDSTLYDALVKSYNTDKDIFESYGEVFSLKRSRDERDKDRDPFVGSDRGTKRRKSSKDVESSRDSRSKEKKSSSTYKDASQSQHKSSGKSAHVEEPSHNVEASGMQQDQEFVM
ncbi:hypothetical protein Tco_1293796 [Tanacetum coccineum]